MGVRFSRHGPGANRTQKRERHTIATPPADSPDLGSPWEALAPLLLNTWKHHAAALRHRIQHTAAGDLHALASNLVVIGTELMDLYLGALSPAEIGQEVLAQLAADGTLAGGAFADSLRVAGGYRLVDLSDSSRWVLRMGDAAGRYVHVHPGRYSPHTRRVRANVLKTAVMVLAYAAVHGGNPTDVKHVNEVRREFLALPPVGKELAGEQGLGVVIDLLRSG